MDQTLNFNSMFFQNWDGLIHTTVVSSLSFIVLVALLRIFGKKMLLKTSASIERTGNRREGLLPCDK